MASKDWCLGVDAFLLQRAYEETDGFGLSAYSHSGFLNAIIGLNHPSGKVVDRLYPNNLVAESESDSIAKLAKALEKMETSVVELALKYEPFELER